jgi:predicted ATPase
MAFFLRWLAVVCKNWDYRWWFMITEIVVSNYRSLGPDVRVKLGPLTALVGPNGAGKSNVADVFKFLAESLTVGLEAAIASRHGIDVVRRWSSGRPFNLSIRMNWKEESFSGTYQFTLAGDSAEDYRRQKDGSQ